jgi:hypothetical protein
MKINSGQKISRALRKQILKCSAVWSSEHLNRFLRDRTQTLFLNSVIKHQIQFQLNLLKNARSDTRKVPHIGDIRGSIGRVHKPFLPRPH